MLELKFVLLLISERAPTLKFMYHLIFQLSLICKCQNHLQLHCKQQQKIKVPINQVPIIRDLYTIQSIYVSPNSVVLENHSDVFLKNLSFL